MNYNYKFLLLVLFYSATLKSFSQSPRLIKISSPDKNIQVQFRTTKDGKTFYSISYRSQPVLKESRLGLAREEENFATGLQLVKTSPVENVFDKYELFAGKKSQITYKAKRLIIQLENKSGKKINIIFQVSDDGVAFQYHFPEKDLIAKDITEEYSSFHFDTTTRGFLQPMQISKSGWEQTNPAYEEHYKQNILVTERSPYNAGWVYPALFHTSKNWVLITEASVDSNYCATRLQSASPDGDFRIGFPDAKEIKTGGGILPRFSTPYYTPWRIITIGSLKTIIESTMGTDLAKPAISFDKSFIKPGKASWSWIMSKDDSIIYSEQLRYIDFAARMNWQFCLVDAAWDRKIG
ncbi:MAG: glycoside hydrolase family 97 N-terminal domain-containing protein, partial [Flavisolibacter sp.]